MARAIGRGEVRGTHMSTQAQEDKFVGAREQAQAQFESIREMVQAFEVAKQKDHDTNDMRDYENAERAIREDALSVQVRSAWHSPGEEQGQHPAEYEILLCTGGPAVRIVGELSEHCEPETARLEMQDWFLPWTEYPVPSKSQSHGTDGPYIDGDAEDVLLAYANCFWYGG